MTPHKTMGKMLFLSLLLSPAAYANMDMQVDQRADLIQPDANGPQFIKDQYIIFFKDGSDAAIDFETRSEIVNELLEAHDGELLHLYRHALPGFSAKLGPLAVERIRNLPFVERVDGDMIGHTTGTDTGATWGLDRIDERTSPRDGSYRYWGTASGVHAYVLDTGIRSTHNDFGGRVSGGTNILSSGSLEDTCNGHGTHVAGTIGGDTYGVAKEVLLHPVRVADCGGSVSSSNYVAGVDWIIDNHISPAVTNISLSFGENSSVETATKNLVEAGVTTVVAAGNNESNACNYSPAGVAKVLTLGNSDSSDRQYDNPTGSTGSNWGSCVDLYAPGTSITSTSHTSDSGTRTLTGTSMASPHAAGVAALYLSNHPTALPVEVNSAIIGHATQGELTDLGSGSPNLLLYSLPGNEMGEAVAVGDFNRDGYDDVAIGVPGYDDGGAGDAGRVEIYLGSATTYAIGSTPDQIFTQDTSGISGASEDGDRFGATLAVGDFDGDFYDDLAIGMPGDGINGHPEAGAVAVLYGDSTGLSTTGDQRWHQDLSDIQGAAEDGDHFGAALVAGDFDGDDYDDLAIGAPMDSINGALNAGAVTVIYGTASGLNAAGDQRFHQDNSSIPGTAENGDLFGATLAAGEIDSDYRDDLVIGSPTEDFNGEVNPGRVVILYSTSTGLSASGAEGWHQDTTNVNGYVETGDFFGAALTIGDFDRDYYDDLVVGVTGEAVAGTSGTVENAGWVNVIYGASGGLTATGDQGFHQDSTNVNGYAEQGDIMGRALCTGQFDDDNYADLSFGVPGDSVGSDKNAGWFQTLYGTSSGLSATGDTSYSQDSSSVLDSAEPHDFMGAAMAAGDLDNDGYDDMVVGIPREDYGSNRDDNGGVQVFFGGASGVSTLDAIRY